MPKPSCLVAQDASVAAHKVILSKRASSSNNCSCGSVIVSKGSFFVKHRNIILEVREEDFNLYREMHAAALKQYDLYANEEDLFGI